MNFIIMVSGITCVTMAGLMGLVAIIFPQTAGAFGESFLITGLVGGLILIANGRPKMSFRPQLGFLLTASVWMVAALAGWRKLKPGIGTEAWFCDPQATWQKGSVENLDKEMSQPNLSSHDTDL